MKQNLPSKWYFQNPVCLTFCAVTWSIFHVGNKVRWVLKFSSPGLLKNGQKFFCMWSGTRENNKIKVQTVLLDTLYILTIDLVMARATVAAPWWRWRMATALWLEWSPGVLGVMPDPTLQGCIQGENSLSLVKCLMSYNNRYPCSISETNSCSGQIFSSQISRVYIFVCAGWRASLTGSGAMWAATPAKTPV